MKLKDRNKLGIAAPIFQIDLSREPKDRYTELALAYQEKLPGLIALFNDLLETTGIPAKYHHPINVIAKLLLRRLHSSIETEELRGISKAVNVPMYLLVAFNVILDLLMGCTSGAVRSLEPKQSKNEARMLHFRTLDWLMDPLRSVIVQLEFVRSKSNTPTKVIARSITYCGYVGVLTGVREQLSLSLNFRGLHNANTKVEHFRFYFHHLLVLLGFRRSISSILRGYLFSDDHNDQDVKGAESLAVIAEEIPPQHTTAAYLTFCDGESTIILEKDFSSAQIRSSNTFIAATNHDEGTREPSFSGPTPATDEKALNPSRFGSGIEDIIAESEERLDCITAKWRSQVQRTERRLRGAATSTESLQTEADTSVSERELIRWVSAYPTTNECTHFAAMMNPKTGTVLWNRVYPDLPLDLEDD